MKKMNKEFISKINKLINSDNFMIQLTILLIIIHMYFKQ